MGKYGLGKSTHRSISRVLVQLKCEIRLQSDWIGIDVPSRDSTSLPLVSIGLKPLRLQ